MKIVIDIPEGLKDVFENQIVTALDVEVMREAIRNGTLLPRGHGRLIDADSLKKTLDYYIQEAGWSKEHNESLEWCRDEFIDSELTILKADKETEE